MSTAIAWDAVPHRVLPVAEARADLSRAIARFREAGALAEPVIFGSHRKPEAVVIPYALFELLLPDIEETTFEIRLRERLLEEGLSGEEALAQLGMSVDSFHPRDASIIVSLDD